MAKDFQFYPVPTGLDVQIFWLFTLAANIIGTLEFGTEPINC